MLRRNIVRPSASSWSPPIVLVQKKDGSVRVCLDYRELNKIKCKDVYPMPRIDHNARLQALGMTNTFRELREAHLVNQYTRLAQAESGRQLLNGIHIIVHITEREGPEF